MFFAQKLRFWLIFHRIHNFFHTFEAVNNDQ